jgi:hypothetical protein
MCGNDERNVRLRFGQLKSETKVVVCVPRIPIIREHTLRKLRSPPQSDSVPPRPGLNLFSGIATRLHILGKN